MILISSLAVILSQLTHNYLIINRIKALNHLLLPQVTTAKLINKLIQAVLKTKIKGYFQASAERAIESLSNLLAKVK